MFKWGTLTLVLLGIAAIPFFYGRIDNVIRCEAQDCLAEYFPGMRVVVRGATLEEGQGIELRDVSIIDESDTGAVELLRIESVFVSCRADWEELLHREVDISHVELVEPTLCLVRGSDGSWRGMEALQQEFTPGGRPIPSISVIDGTIEIRDEIEQRFQASNASNMQRVTPLAVRLRDVDFYVDSRTEREGELAFRGSFGGDFVEDLDFAGTVLLGTGQWNINGNARTLELSRDIMAAYPLEFGDLPPELASLSAIVDARFEVASDETAPWGCRFAVHGTLSNGQFDDPRLERPLSKMRTTFHLDQDNYSLTGLTAECGDATFLLDCRHERYLEHGPLHIKARARDFELTSGVRYFLPSEMAAKWDEYSPSGRVHLDAELDYIDGRWISRGVRIECLDVGFAHVQVPFNISEGRGVITLGADEQLIVDLLIHTSGTPIRIGGTIRQALSTPHGLIEVGAEEVPIDDKLMAMLSPKSRAVVESLHSKGKIQIGATIQNLRPGAPFETDLRIRMNGLSVSYEKFMYPLTDVHGLLHMRNDRWVFSELTAKHGSAFITGYGGLTPTGPDSREFVIALQSERLPLDQALRDAFQNESMRRLWDDFSVTGAAKVRTEIRYSSNSTGLDVAIDATSVSKETSIQPAWFPYQLEQLEGQFSYRDGQVVVRGMRGKHDDVQVASDVVCDFRPDGSWQLFVSNLAVDQLHVDRDFLATAPEPLKDAVAPLNLDGPLNLSGRVLLAKAPNPSKEFRVDWDLRVALHQVDCNVGFPVSDVCGGLSLLGCHADGQFHCGGRLDIDSLVYKNVQLTHLTGPFRIQQERILLGVSAPSNATLPCRFNKPKPDTRPPGVRPTEKPESVMANVFAGNAYVDGWVGIGGRQTYQLYTRVHGVQLANAVRDMAMPNKKVGGTINGAAEITGQGRNLHLLRAKGNLELRQGDIYQSPIMLSVLRNVSMRNTDRSTFSDADIRFRVEGGRVLLEDIVVHGSTISMKGSGEMDFDENIKLRLGTRLGRDMGQPGILRQALGTLGEQFVVFDVTGTLSEPQVVRNTLPGVREAFEQLQNDLQPIGAAVPPAPPTGHNAAEPATQPLPFWGLR